MTGRISAFIKGYVFFDMDGEVDVTEYIKKGPKTIEIVRFASIYGNFDYEDRTADTGDIITKSFRAMIVSVKLIKEKSGFVSICVLDIL